ncbi:MAG: Type 4 prepilin-like proteins leader peptide-processing enzyme [Elusimicrobia bacterium]|nr:Type 4 prepilin-like proteins leader peptide-processing enzyme [Elusimicrobiota bacterium]
MDFLLILFLSLEFGSFANVCIARWPVGKSILQPIRSHCPWCEHKISWWQNIPLVSFVMLKGRCGHCRSAIAWRYPVTEILTPLVWLTGLIGIRHSQLITSIPFFLLSGIFFFTLIVATATDLDWKIIPDESTYTLIFASIAFSPWNSFLFTTNQMNLIPFFNSLVSGFLIAIPTGIFAWLGKKLIGKETLGGGDLKLLFGFGCFLGWESGLTILLMASLIGTTIVLAFLALKKMKRSQYFPFGPFLTLSALIEFHLRCKNISLLDLALHSKIFSL